MKTKNLIALVLMGIISILGISAAYAGSVTVPNTFQPGTTARAAEVNTNFQAVKTAVDDNDIRINSLTASKQNRISVSCAVGSAIRVINPDGTVVCEIDDNTALNAAAPVTITGGTIGLANGGITNGHISAMAAIAASKISGDVGIEYGGFWANQNLSSTPASLGSITLTAPSSGTILLFLNGTADVPQGTIIGYGIGTSPTSPNLVQRHEALRGSFMVMVAHNITAAGDYTYHALAEEVDPTNCCTVRAYDVNLVGLFIPKRY